MPLIKVNLTFFKEKGVYDKKEKVGRKTDYFY